MKKLAACLETAVLLVATLNVCAEPIPHAYLPVTGPAPMRFLTPRPADAKKPSLPPLLMEDPVPPPAPAAVTAAVSTNSAAKPTSAPTNSPAVVAMAPATVQAQTNQLVPATNAAPAAAPGVSASEFPLIDSADSGRLMTPQMLMQFFKSPNGSGQTNAPQTAVALPLFTPPKPVGPPPSSSAAYSVR